MPTVVSPTAIARAASNRSRCTTDGAPNEMTEPRHRITSLARSRPLRTASAYRPATSSAVRDATPRTSPRPNVRFGTPGRTVRFAQRPPEEFEHRRHRRHGRARAPVRDHRRRTLQTRPSGPDHPPRGDDTQCTPTTVQLRRTCCAPTAQHRPWRRMTSPAPSERCTDRRSASLQARLGARVREPRRRTLRSSCEPGPVSI